MAEEIKAITDTIDKNNDLNHNTYINVRLSDNTPATNPLEQVLSSDLNNVETPIVDALEHCYQNPSMQFHIPGHTKGKAILPKFKNLIGKKAVLLDRTDEFDNTGTLHPATGPIEKAQELAAQAFGAAKTFFLVNGSTIGNLALALTVTKPNQKVLIGRNCHRSVTNGITLSGAHPVWLIPDKLDNWSLWGGITPQNIEQQIEKHPDIKVVWLTNPTYEGVVSDTEAIAKVCKKHNLILIVDEAHGSLWNFNNKFPKTAIQAGADAVVNSMHKTGGSLSQSSVLHLAKNSKISASLLESNIKMLHTTSPSYLLLASIDAARAYISSQTGLKNIEECVQNALYLRSRISKNPKVKLLSNNNEFSVDPTKVYLMVEGLSGKRLESILEIEYHIEVESATDNGILALCNIGNTREDIEYFCECLESITNSNYSDISYLEKTKYMPLIEPKIIYTPRDAFHMEKEHVPTKKAVGRIAGELIAECPPGISVFVPGELIREEHLPYLTRYKTVTVIKE